MSLVSGSVRELANGDIRAAEVIALDANGNPVVFPTAVVPPAVSNVFIFTANTTSQTLLAADVNRRQFVINNISGSTVRISLGPVANSTVYSFVLSNNTSYESPLGGYTGQVSIARQSGTGNVVVTDITL